MNKTHFLSDVQLTTGLEKCEYGEEKPCQAACPLRLLAVRLYHGSHLN